MKLIMTTFAACSLAFAAHAQTETDTSKAPSSAAEQKADQKKTEEMKPSEMGQKPMYGTGTNLGETAGWPDGVTPINIEKGKLAQASGSLAEGHRIESLNLPSRCLDASDKAMFSGNQVLFGVTLPANTDLKITVKPSDPKQEVSVYAYALPANRYDLPSAAAAAEDCKISVAGKSSLGKAMKGEDRVIRFDSKKVERNFVIGVSGTAEASTAAFNVSVHTGK